MGALLVFVTNDFQNKMTPKLKNDMSPNGKNSSFLCECRASRDELQPARAYEAGTACAESPHVHSAAYWTILARRSRSLKPARLANVPTSPRASSSVPGHSDGSSGLVAVSLRNTRTAQSAPQSSARSARTSKSWLRSSIWLTLRLS